MHFIDNTFGVKVSASSYVEYSDVAQLKNALQSAQKPFLHIGRASNLLFTKDFEGTVFHCVNKNIEILSESDSVVEVRVGAGLVWDSFVAHCVENGWGGVENLSLIPGEVGAAAVQNIGAYGAEAKDVISRVNAFDTESLTEVTLSNAECGYSYRNSFFKSPEAKRFFIVSVEFILCKQPEFKLEYGNLKEAVKEPSLKAIREAIIEIRRNKLPDPEQIGNAGSFFMNPVVPFSKYEELKTQYPDIPHYPAAEGFVKLSAGWLIEQCGWKGRSMGKAAIYQKQALIVVNTGGATGQEILDLAAAVVSAVELKFDITLKMEVQVV
ncbi:MAG: UDP-N-acetylmuramate dehydrogenase [Bacteroidales bacterium]|nr:UDP-N-acetylmuramate dehydrogenase [Bacteroidales bacterium]